MDTSDGLFSTLDQLMRLNNLGFELNYNWESLLDKESKLLVSKKKLPIWFLLAGQHGEFELIFTIPPKDDQKFKKAAKSIKWNPQFLGVVISEPQIKIPLYKKKININTRGIRNLSISNKSEIKNYIETLIQMDKNLQKSR